MSKKEPNVYIVEFKIEAIHNLKPECLITEQIQVMKHYEDKTGELYLGTLIQANDEDQAEPLGRELINEFFDYYCTVFGAALSISPDGDPYSITQVSGGGRFVMPISFKVPKIFVYDEKISKYIFANIQTLRKKEFAYLRNAMYYYRKAKSEELDTAKLILYFIALEALFSTSNQEITYRFSNRLAVLIGTSGKEKTSITEDASKFYSKRSRIVHGSEIILDKDLIIKIDGWVKKSLSYFMELIQHFSDHDKLLNFLDKALLDKKSYNKLIEYRKPVDEHIKKLEKQMKELKKNKKSIQETK